MLRFLSRERFIIYFGHNMEDTHQKGKPCSMLQNRQNRKLVREIAACSASRGKLNEHSLVR
jgi:hypothetical protein